MATTTAPFDSRERGYAGADSPVSPPRAVDTSISVTSAISWGAIIGGAAGAAALSLILLILGVGLGLSSVSPWSYEGISATTFGVSTIVWLTITQLISSGVGGYLAGRLRTKWRDAATDEIYFRDTAHGFLAWAIATLATAAMLTSVTGAILSGGLQAGASVVGGAASTASMAAAPMVASGQMASGNSGPMGYFVDSLFRRNGNAAEAGSQTTTAIPSTIPAETSDRAAQEAAEVSRIFMNVSRTEPLPPDDVRHVGQLVAQRTGLSQQEAEKRVTDVYTRAQEKLRQAEVAAKDAADKARKASAYSALWMFVSLLVGAFVASLAATFGGRQRDA